MKSRGINVHSYDSGRLCLSIQGYVYGRDTASSLPLGVHQVDMHAELQVRAFLGNRLAISREATDPIQQGSENGHNACSPGYATDQRTSNAKEVNCEDSSPLRTHK